MQAMSTKMLLSLQGPHRPMIVVKSLSVKGVTTNIPIVSGTIKEDRTASDARRTIDMTVNDLSFVPQNDWDPLNVYGNRLYAYRGVLWNEDEIDPRLWTCSAAIPPSLLRPSNGAYELVPIGVFRINSVELSEDTDGDVTIDVKGTDLSAVIAKNQWTGPATVSPKPYIVPIAATDTTGENVFTSPTIQAAIRDLVTDRWPHSTVFGPPVFDFAGVPSTPILSPIICGAKGVSTTGSNSPWTDISGLAAACNGELYMGPSGAVTLRNFPDPNTIPPVWTIRDGENGLLVSVDRTISDAKTINYVIATGENSGLNVSLDSLALAQADAILGAQGQTNNIGQTGITMAIRATAEDDDATSPTFVNGPFGRVVGYEPGRKLLRTLGAVQAAATAYLTWFTGGDESLTIKANVNPALVSGDVIRVRHKRLGIYDPNVIVAVLSSSVSSSFSAVYYTPSVTHTIGQATLGDGKLHPINSLSVEPLIAPIAKGTQLTIFTDYIQQTIVTSAYHNKGESVLNVETFTPLTDYIAQTVIKNPTEKSDGSVNYYIDQITLPLDIDTPMSIVCRERRVGTKQDAIRVGEYSQTDS